MLFRKLSDIAYISHMYPEKEKENLICHLKSTSREQPLRGS